MIKALEALCYLDDIANGRKMSLDPHKLKLIVEKDLKAFGIIKDKFVNVTIFMGCDSLEEYNNHPLTMRKGRLTQEEYDLLKEVLE